MAFLVSDKIGEIYSDSVKEILFHSLLLTDCFNWTI